MRWPAVFSRPVAAVNSPASFVPGTLVERRGSSCYYLVAVRYCGHGKEGRNAKADDVDVYDCRQADTLGTVEAAEERGAIQKAAEEFSQPATKLYAVRPS
jgi:hypothetical protein